jgi:hypothetical protein
MQSQLSSQLSDSTQTNLKNIDRQESLNERISSRNIPSSYLEPQFSMRPVPTKYVFMPMIDSIQKSSVPIASTMPYNVGKTFNPGTAQAPWSGYANNVDIETILRNQTFALQKCDQSLYVPSSMSDLYNVSAVGRQEEQTHPGLFEQPHLESFNPNSLNIATDVFNNATRQQIKNVQ